MSSATDEQCTTSGRRLKLGWTGSFQHHAAALFARSAAWPGGTARGAGLVLDCVGVQPTVDLGARLLGRNSVWTIVGLGGGHHDSTTAARRLVLSQHSVLRLARRADGGDCDGTQRTNPCHTEFALEDAVAVYEKLKAGQITGPRAYTLKARGRLPRFGPSASKGAWSRDGIVKEHSG